MPPTNTDSPSRLPMKLSRSPSKLKEEMVPPSSPFSIASAFSPVQSTRKSSRASTPLKTDENDASGHSLLGSGGEDSICSNFSDFSTPQFGAASAGFGDMLEKENVGEEKDAVSVKAETASTGSMPEKIENERSPRKNSVKVTPKTPRLGSPRTVSRATTPQTIRARSELTTPRARPTLEKPFSPSPLTSPRTPTQTSNAPMLMDFTAQFDRITRPSKTPLSKLGPTRSIPESPNKKPLPPSTPTESRFYNLLDFSPAPIVSPSSIPSITPREVEEIKASFESQLAQLRAQIAGRDTEALGLREALASTELRCQKLAQEIAEASARHEHDREEWMRIKTEMGELFAAEKAEKESIQDLLADKERVVEHLQDEVDKGAEEIKSLKKRVRDAEDDGDRCREEIKKLQLDLKSVKAAAAENPTTLPTLSTDPNPDFTKAEVERVARELHTLYKKKHEDKVAALKKSYEARWEKKVSALEAMVANLTKENTDLKTQLEDKKAEDLAADMSFARELIPGIAATGIEAETQALKQEVETLKSQLAEEKNKKQQEQQQPEEYFPEKTEKLKKQIKHLETQLEEEREERIQVIALVDELLSLQQAEAAMAPTPQKRMSPSDQERDDAKEERAEKARQRVSGVAGPGNGRFGATPLAKKGMYSRGGGELMGKIGRMREGAREKEREKEKEGVREKSVEKE